MYFSGGGREGVSRTRLSRSLSAKSQQPAVARDSFANCAFRSASAAAAVTTRGHSMEEEEEEEGAAAGAGFRSNRSYNRKKERKKSCGRSKLD